MEISKQLIVITSSFFPFFFSFFFATIVFVVFVLHF